MRKITFTFTAMILAFAAQADCVFQSFVIGEQYSIGNMLEWTTAEESDNQMFIIEKSLDGMEFQEAGQVEAIGDSDEAQTYRFMDLDARKGRTHYRIKQVDVDGDFSYSRTATVNKDTENEIMIASITSNEGNTSIGIMLDATKEMTLDYAVQDIMGDVLESAQAAVMPGLNDVVFDLSAYPNGTYKLVLQSGEEEETLTIRKSDPGMPKIPVASKN